MLKSHQLLLERHFQPVFAPVDLEVRGGELWLITGANGAGKTTLIRLLAGLARPTSGRLLREAGTVAYLGHQLGLKADLSVVENLAFAAALSGGDALPIQRTLERLDLADASHQAARTLSAGQRKRCALARLSLTPASLWLLDEPYANLDAPGVKVVDALLAEHLDGGGACVMSTHGALRPPDLPWRELAIQPWEAPA